MCASQGWGGRLEHCRLRGTQNRGGGQLALHLLRGQVEAWTPCRSCFRGPGGQRGQEPRAGEGQAHLMSTSVGVPELGICGDR